MAIATLPYYIDLETPWHAYYMTVSGHANYSFMGNNMSKKHRDIVESLDASDGVKAYHACQYEVELMLSEMVAQLDAKGILEDTVFVMSADHYPYALTDAELAELYGIPETNIHQNFDLLRNGCIIWCASMEEPIVVDKVACSMDIVPTLSNLFGLDYDARLFMGRDVLSEQHKGLVIFSNRSFITDKVMFNGVTGEVTLLTEEELPADYIQRMNHIVNQKFQYSAKIIEQDYYQYFTSYLEQSPESE